jgi:hypothetical protein
MTVDWTPNLKCRLAAFAHSLSSAGLYLVHTTDVSANALRAGEHFANGHAAVALFLDHQLSQAGVAPADLIRPLTEIATLLEAACQSLETALQCQGDPARDRGGPTQGAHKRWVDSIARLNAAIKELRATLARFSPEPL